MKYARFSGGTAVEIFTPPAGLTLADCFHADVAAQFKLVPDNVTPGSTVDAAGKWTIAAVVAPAAPVAVLPFLAPMDFYLAFKTQERVDIKASKDPFVMEFWDTYQRAERTGKPIDPNAPSVQEGLEYLAIPAASSTPFGTPGPGILKTPDRIAQILAGVAQ